ncbi:MAG TPA: hypothetical protein VK966_13825 [Longimicrobiales bacterium]|nr:hypothetical protein [Longimicrobiales bacterium]
MKFRGLSSVAGVLLLLAIGVAACTNITEPRMPEEDPDDKKPPQNQPASIEGFSVDLYV